MMRTCVRKAGWPLVKATSAARQLNTISRHSLLSANTPLKTSIASKLRPLAITTQKRYAADETSSPPDPSDSFLSGSAANYIDEMYMQWKEDPTSVHISWQVYFKNMESGEMPMSKAFTPPPTLVPRAATGVAAFMPRTGMAASESDNVNNHFKGQLLVLSYQAPGHL